MNKLTKTLLIILLMGVFIFAESCVVKDCKGRRKTSNTSMGGWL